MAERNRTIVLWVIRSGKSSWQLEGRMQGQTDLPLAPGEKMAVMEEAGRQKRGGPKMIHHPQDEAASETARMMGTALKARVKGERELADPNLGLLEGLTVGEFEERYPTRYRQWEEERLMLAPPEGEEFSAARARVLARVARILKRSRSGDAAVVVHEEAWRFVRGWLRKHERIGEEEGGMMVERYAMTVRQVEEMAAAGESGGDEG